MDRAKYKDRKSILAFILVVGLLIILWHYKELSLLLFSIPFFLAVFFFHKFDHNIFGLLVLILFLFSTPALDTFVQLRNTTKYSFENKREVFEELFTPGSGLLTLESIPSEVKEMLILLDRYPLKNYQISTGLEENPLILQRIIETSWPIKMEPFSQYSFLYISEKNLYKDCEEIGHETEIILVYCP